MLPTLTTKQKIFLSYILSKLLIFIFGNKKRKIIRNHINYEIDFNEGIDLGIFLNIKNEKKIFNLKKFFHTSDKINIIDIGSNVGSVSLPLASFYKKTQVYSIEPTIYAYKKLCKNINLNNIDLKKRIKPLNYFIGLKKNVKYVYSSWNYSSDKKHKIHLGSLKKINNKFISIDNLILKIKKKISFIKIDVDGHELEVLKSGKNYLKKNHPIIHIEFAPYLHSEYGYSTEELINFIEQKLKYEIYNEDLKKIFDIKNYVKKIVNRSENFFLIKKNRK